MQRTIPWHVTLVALVFSVTALQAAEPHVGRFTRYETADFVIITSRSGEQARKFVEQIGKFRLTLERMLGKRATRSVFPTHIVIASDSDWTKWLRPRENVAGFFQSARFANYLAMDGDADLDEAVHVMLHEYTHYYLASQFDGEYPPWFNEGLAELMSYAKFDKGMAILRVPLDQVHEAANSSWIPFERMLEVDQNDPEYQAHELVPSFYAQAWLTMHYGLVENRAFGRQIIDYIHYLNELKPRKEAAREAFGADLAAPDKLLRDYSHNPHMSSGAINLGDVLAATLPAGKPIDELDAMCVFADLMLSSHFPPGRVQPLVEAINRRETSARGAILAARLATADDDNDAFDAAAANAAKLLGPDDWTQRRALATTLLASAIDTSVLSKRTTLQSDRDLKDALRLYGQVVTHDAGDVESLWGFGTAATRLGKNLDVAEQALKAAYTLAPGTPEIAVSLANLKGRQEKVDEMIPYLKDARKFAHDLSTRRWATDTLADMQKFIAERDARLEEAKRQRDEYEKKLADYEKKNGKKKKS